MENSKEEILFLNQTGWLVGPKETKETFLQRVKTTRECGENLSLLQDQCFPLNQKVKKPHWQWVKAHLLSLFDIAPESFLAFFNDKKFSFFEGAAMWICSVDGQKVPVIQIRKPLAKGSWLYFYTLEELLAHEAVHAARVAFDEPRMEEFFAYMSSSSSFRKVLGPLVKNSWEVWVFFSLFFIGIVFQSFSYEILPALSALCFSACLLFLSVGFVRLFRMRRIFVKAFNKLFLIFQKKSIAMAVLVRLTDEEIQNFSKSSLEKIYQYVDQDKTFRWQVIKSSYFSKIHKKYDGCL